MMLEATTRRVAIKTHFSLMLRLVWWASFLLWHSAKDLKKKPRQLTRRMSP
jgi:hypothetical protein